MDVLDGRPVWSLSDGELMPAFDSLDAEIIRLQNLRLQFIARIEETGYAQELGARDAVELVSFRHRRDRAEAWRDVRLTRALPRYAAVTKALANGIEIPAPHTANKSTAPAGEEAGASKVLKPGEAAQTTEITQTPGVTEAGQVTEIGEVTGADDEGERVVRPMQSAHATAIVFELERVRSRVPVDVLDVAEEQLVQLAAHLAPAELRAAAKEICNLLDADGPEPEEKKAYDRESLTLTNAHKGVKFRGYLANENAELLRAVVHAGARPHKTVDGEQDPRPREKRQADALTTALTLAAAAWDTNNSSPQSQEKTAHNPFGMADTASPWSAPAHSNGTPSTGTPSSAPRSSSAADSSSGRGVRVPGYGAKANITVAIDLEDLKAATADAIGRTVYSDGLSAATIRRLACDANVIPLVLGSNSEPLDVGRGERLVTRAMRRALNARDRGCVICGAPPVMCDAHHLISWIDGGETKVDNLALVCRRHHTDIHHGHWRITITNGQVHVARPTWADPPPLHANSAGRGPARPQPTSSPDAFAQPATASSTRPGPPNDHTRPAPPRVSSSTAADSQPPQPTPPSNPSPTPSNPSPGPSSSPSPGPSWSPTPPQSPGPSPRPQSTFVG